MDELVSSSQNNGPGQEAVRPVSMLTAASAIGTQDAQIFLAPNSTEVFWLHLTFTDKSQIFGVFFHLKRPGNRGNSYEANISIIYIYLENWKTNKKVISAKESVAELLRL